jgi:small subunit ribosomal protein S7
VESKGDLGSEAVLEKALLNVSPILEVRSVRIAGSTYQIPFPIPSKRQQSLGISWIVKSARNRSERDMVSRLAGELIDASRGIGVSIRKRNELHKIAEANRAFAHYRWM